MHRREGKLTGKGAGVQRPTGTKRGGQHIRLRANTQGQTQREVNTQEGKKRNTETDLRSGQRQVSPRRRAGI